MRAAHVIRYLRCLLCSRIRSCGSAVRQWPLCQLREPLRCYVISMPVLAIALIGLAVPPMHWRISQLAVFTALVVCAAIAIEATRTVDEPRGTLTRDLQSVWYLAIAIALPPFFALAAPVPLTAYKLWRVPRGVVHRRVFSNATLCLAYGCASLAFHAIPASVAGAAPGAGVHAVTWTAAVLACGAIAWAVNHAPLTFAVRLSDRTARLRSLVASRETVISDVVELSLAVSLCLLVAINPVLMTLTLPSLVLHRRHLLHGQLVNQARIDTKTGLLNAATWQREADVELARAVRTRTPLAIAVADIDHFKRVNDTFGHLAGDRVLRELAQTLHGSLRDYDIVGRFGGEEFTLLLPHTDPTEAEQIAERIRDQVGQRVMTIDDGSREGYPLRVTVSIGVATLSGSRRDLNDLIAAADSALYQAKNSGRDTVRVLADTGAGYLSRDDVQTAG